MSEFSLRGSLLSLLPLCLFLLTFVTAGIVFSMRSGGVGFYAFSPAWATLPGIALALFMAHKQPVERFLKPFLKGMTDTSILLMCCIFMLSGIFSGIAQSLGAVDAVVNLGLTLIPSWFLLPGLFMVVALLSTAMGTSVGVIAAVAPIVLGVAQTAQVDLPLAAGVVLSGAMFGDNLSIISDTSIAASGTQQCSPKQKFKANLKLALLPSLAVIFIYICLSPSAIEVPVASFDWIKILPYGLIFSLALLGCPVLWVLSAGIVCEVIILSVLGIDAPLLHDVGQGMLAMRDITSLTLSISGLGYIMERKGGMAFVVAYLESKFDHSKRQASAEKSIALLVSVCNLATANNTIAILLSGGAARNMAQAQGVNPGRAASLLDIFSCVVQGVIPWGAQLLLLGTIFGLSPLVIIPYCFYPFLLLLFTLLSMRVNKS